MRRDRHGAGPYAGHGRAVGLGVDHLLDADAAAAARDVDHDHAEAALVHDLREQAEVGVAAAARRCGVDQCQRTRGTRGNRGHGGAGEQRREGGASQERGKLQHACLLVTVSLLERVDRVRVARQYLRAHGLLGDPLVDPADALRVGNGALELHERPVGRPHEALLRAGAQQGIDVLLRIRALEPVRRRQLDPGLPVGERPQDVLKAGVLHAELGVRVAEVIDDDRRAFTLHERHEVREQPPLERDLDEHAELAQPAEQRLPVALGRVGQRLAHDQVQADAVDAARLQILQGRFSDVRIDDRGATQPALAFLERRQQQRVVGAVEARCGQHAEVHAAGIHVGEVLRHGRVERRRRVDVRRQRNVGAHDVRMAVDGARRHRQPGRVGRARGHRRPHRLARRGDEALLERIELGDAHDLVEFLERHEHVGPFDHLAGGERLAQQFEAGTHALQRARRSACAGRSRPPRRGPAARRPRAAAWSSACAGRSPCSRTAA